MSASTSSNIKNSIILSVSVSLSNLPISLPSSASGFNLVPGNEGHLISGIKTRHFCGKTTKPEEHPERVILTGQAAERGEELIRLLRLGERRRRRLLLLLLVPPRVERRGGGQGCVGAEGHAPAAAAVVLAAAVVQQAVGDEAVGVVLMVGVVTWVLVLVVALVQPSS